MKKYLVVVAMVVALLLTLPGCALLGGGEEVPEAPPATPASIPALQSEINTLKTQVSSLSSQLASVSVSPTDTSGIEASIAVLQTQIADLTVRLATLEAEEDSGGSSNGGSSTSSGEWDAIRWYLRDVEMTYKSITGEFVGDFEPVETEDPPVWADLSDGEKDDIEDGIDAIVQTSPRTIKDEDLYDVELMASNRDGDWEITLVDVVFVLSLSTSDYALLDDEATYLDSDRPPFLVWEADFMTREREGHDVTRRVTFESDKFAELEIGANNYETFDLVLELYYA